MAGLGTFDVVIEALWQVTPTSWDEYRKITPNFEAWRHMGLTMDQRKDVAAQAMSFVEKSPALRLVEVGYAPGGIGGLAWARYLATFGALKGEAYALRRLMFTDAFPICNWVWAKAYQTAIGYRFGVKAAWTTPDAMHDHVVRSRPWHLVDKSGT